MTLAARTRLAALALLLGACSQPTDVFLGTDESLQAPPATNEMQGMQPAMQPPIAPPPPSMVELPPPSGGLIDAGKPVPELGPPFLSDAGEPRDAALADVIDAGPPAPLDCATGTADCDDDRSNGCETDTNTDLQNCGGCARLCHTMGHDAITATCVAGRCELTCRNDGVGDTDCDGDPDNGCETKTFTDTKNCGACGMVCNACFNGFCF